jgi:hypothetical protein
MFTVVFNINSRKGFNKGAFVKMALKDFFLVFSKNDDGNVIKKKLASLERSMEEIKKSLAEMQEKNYHENADNQKEPPIMIEKINIEKIILDKYELNNNFGQLGIKELKGRLNIGATYGSEFTPKINNEEKKEDKREDTIKNKEKDQQKGPKINIQTKNENKKD